MKDILANRLDIELSRQDIQGLSRGDAISAFFAKLGYNTEARTTQTAGNLGITADTVARPIKKSSCWPIKRVCFRFICSSFLKEGSDVTASFLNVTILTAAFLNAAVAQLYGSFTEKQVRAKLKLKDIQPDDLELLKRVVETARQYFKDPKRFNKAFQDLIA